LIQSYKYFLFFLIFTSIFSACEIINPDEKIPGYIYIDTVIVKSNIAFEGSNSQKISDVWVRVEANNENIPQGIYQLPAKFPILNTGKVKIIIYAGIKNNGIASSRATYPYYQEYIVDTIIEEGKITTIKPIVKYAENTDFLLLENFEDPGLKLKTTSKSNVNLIHSNEDVFEGDYSGLIELNNEDSIFECIAIDSVILPKNQTPVYFEMDYKSNIDLDLPSDDIFTVGLFVTKSSKIIQESIIYLNSTNGKWNKIYIDFTNTITNNQDALHFRVFIGAKKSKLHKDVKIGIDNLKLVTNI
jgi:hypothetical protein